MYFDTKPCTVCGAEIELRAREESVEPPSGDHPVGPRDGVVGGGDDTVDLRVCTNPECPSHSSTRSD